VFGLVQIMGPIYRTRVLLTTNPEGFSGNLQKGQEQIPTKSSNFLKRLEQGFVYYGQCHFTAQVILSDGQVLVLF